MSNQQLLSRELISCDWQSYDFIDLGCSRGGSIGYCQRRFKAGRGLGIDLSEEKVLEASEAGFDVLLADAREIPPGTGVRFISMLDFLEHVPNLDDVAQIISVSAQAATDFLFIRHPSFEGESYLASLGLRQYWWHWSGHSAHIRISDYCTIFERFGLHQYCIKYREPILDSTHKSIHSVDSPINQGEFEESRHAAKPVIAFSEPVWRAQDIFVALRAFSPSEWASIVETR